VQLRQDLVDFENPRETMRKVDEVSEDLLRNALLDLSNEITVGWKKEDVMKEVEAMVALPPGQWAGFLRSSPVLQDRLTELENAGRGRYRLNGGEEEEPSTVIARSDNLKEEYLLSAAEFFANVCASKSGSTFRTSRTCSFQGGFVESKRDLEMNTLCERCMACENRTGTTRRSMILPHGRQDMSNLVNECRYNMKGLQEKAGITPGRGWRKTRKASKQDGEAARDKRGLRTQAVAATRRRWGPR